MARWKCRDCGRRLIRAGNRGSTIECEECGGEVVCLGRGIDLSMPGEEDEQ